MPGPYYQQGTYVCEVTSQAMGESKTGNPQFVLRFKVLGLPIGNGEYDVAEHQYERTHYRSITEKTAQYFAQDLRALEYNRDSFRYLDPTVAGHHSFVGKVVTMTCRHDNDQQGKPRETWSVARADSSAIDVKPLEPKKLRQLDAMFGKHLKGAEKPNGAIPTPLPPPVVSDGSEITDDDIPF